MVKTLHFIYKGIKVPNLTLRLFKIKKDYWKIPGKVQKTKQYNMQCLEMSEVSKHLTYLHTVLLHTCTCDYLLLCANLLKPQKENKTVNVSLGMFAHTFYCDWKILTQRGSYYTAGLWQYRITFLASPKR